MKTTILSAAIGAGFLLQGCVITNSPGFYSGYKKLPEAEQKKIQFIPANQAIPAANGRLIYAVNAQSLLNAMQGSDTTLVYLWAPHCHSEYCASLLSVQDICRKKGYQLHVVAEYFADMEQINLQPKLENPLLAINHRIYKTDYCNKYTNLFAKELRQGKPFPDSTKYSRYYLFKGNNFVRAINNLKDAQPQFSQTPKLYKRN